MKKQLIIGTASMAALALTMPFSIFAESSIVNSIGSVDMNDNGTSVGVDETQSQVTEYYDNSTANQEDSIIKEDATKVCKVYATQASTFSVIIPKTIILDGAKDATKNAGTYVVTVKGNIAGNETVTVVPDNSFQMSQAGKADINATVTQTITEFVVNEKTTVANADITARGVDLDDGAVTTGEVEVSDLSAGSWSGAFEFAIALNTDSTSVTP